MKELMLQMICSDTMDLSVVLGTTFSLFLHTATCEVSIWATGKCADLGLVSLNFFTLFKQILIQKEGEVRIELEWECFGNNTFSCTKRQTLCGKCDGDAIVSQTTQTEDRGMGGRLNYFIGHLLHLIEGDKGVWLVGCNGICKTNGIHETGRYKQSKFKKCGKGKKKYGKRKKKKDV